MPDRSPRTLLASRPLSDLPPPPPGAPAGGLPPPGTRTGSLPPPGGRSPSPPGAGSGPSRATAAVWVAAAGALLLLAAAGTFLAVSWDTMGLTARVATVGAATGAAILGGHRLRSRLPAVGAVIYHLGALLVPIDVLGLALQLGAGPAGRWIAVGATAVTVLPLLAVAGRSPALAWGGGVGVPVLATGVGMAALGAPSAVHPAAPLGPGGGPGGRLAVVAAAPLLVGVAGLLALLLTVALTGAGRMPRRAAKHVRWAAAALAAVAVHGPVLVVAAAAVPTTGGALDHLQAAGWEPTSWVVVLITVTLSVAALVIVATHHRSTVLAGWTLVTAIVGALSVLLPASRPSAAIVVLPAVVALLVEVTALATRDQEPWARPSATLALIVEVLVGLAFVPGVLVALVQVHLVPGLADAAVGVSFVLLAGAWAVAAWRRTAVLAHRPAMIGLASAAALYAAVGSIRAGLPVAVGLAVLLAGSLGILAWRGLGTRPDPSSDVRGWATAAAASLGLAGTGLLVTFGSTSVVWVVAVTAVVTGLHLRSAALALDGVVAKAAPWMLAAAGTSIVLVGAATLEEAAPGWGAVVAVLGPLVVASLAAARREIAHALRGVASVVGIGATSSLLDAVASDTSSVRVVGGVLELGPRALLPSAIVAGWLAVEVVRRRQALVAALAGPVAVRLVASGLLMASVPTRTAGLVMVGIGIVAAVGAALGLGRWTWPAIVVAASAALPGIPLVGPSPELRALLLVAGGLVVAAAGSSRGHAAVTHLGGAVSVLGVWDLLAVREVTALDVWALPLALHLWLAGLAARRRCGTSSWVSEVPALLLVVVPALVERAAGGSGWHAVLAGALSVLAIAAGGSQRLGGPLVVGSVALVAVVGIEVFAVVAVVPTWIWLGFGGFVLLGAAAAMELFDGTPVTTARRLVTVVRERFG